MSLSANAYVCMVFMYIINIFSISLKKPSLWIQLRTSQSILQDYWNVWQYILSNKLSKSAESLTEQTKFSLFQFIYSSLKCRTYENNMIQSYTIYSNKSHHLTEDIGEKNILKLVKK